MNTIQLGGLQLTNMTSTDLEHNYVSTLHFKVVNRCKTNAQNLV